MSSIFQSTRLTYRAIRSEDIDEISALQSDSEVLSGLYITPVLRTLEQRKAALKMSEEWPLNLIAVESQTDAFVGRVTLRYEAPEAMREAELAVSVKQNMWGQSYGTEIVSWAVQHAFKFLGVHRVSLSLFESNSRALAVYKKVGFVHEGTKRRARFFNGRWEDIIFMGIVEDEFFARRD